MTVDAGGCSPGALVLLADSQLLFAPERGRLLQAALRRTVGRSVDSAGLRPFAVYAGASNGCEPAFYQMACDALSACGIEDTLFLKSSLRDLGEQQSGVPAIILLAGGDPLKGWQVLGSDAIRQWLLDCHRAGSLLLGISAGAMHLTAMAADMDGQPRIVPFLDLVPVVTLVHEEQESWPSERVYEQVESQGGRACLKIPFGGGAWFHGNDRYSVGGALPELVEHGQVVTLENLEPI